MIGPSTAHATKPDASLPWWRRRRPRWLAGRRVRVVLVSLLSACVVLLRAESARAGVPLTPAHPSRGHPSTLHAVAASGAGGKGRIRNVEVSIDALGRGRCPGPTLAAGEVMPCRGSYAAKALADRAGVVGLYATVTGVSSGAEVRPAVSNTVAVRRGTTVPHEEAASFDPDPFDSAPTVAVTGGPAPKGVPEPGGEDDVVDASSTDASNTEASGSSVPLPDSSAMAASSIPTSAGGVSGGLSSASTEGPSTVGSSEIPGDGRPVRVIPGGGGRGAPSESVPAGSSATSAMSPTVGSVPVRAAAIQRRPTTTRARRSSISLVKTATSGYHVIGDVIEYTFMISNVGETELVDVRLNDSMEGLTGLNCPSFTGRLAPGASTTCSANYAAVGADIRRGYVDNAAQVSARRADSEGSPNDPRTVTDDDTARSTLAQPSALPFTGAQTTSLGYLAVVLFIAGSGLVLKTLRRRSDLF